MTILAATPWGTNAQMVADCHRLGYINDDDTVLDATYGRGLWWTVWHPASLTTHDRAMDGVDFRELPEHDDHFDVVAFDPPYVAKGGRTTSGIQEMDDRYGMDGAPPSPALVQALIDDGLAEMHRVVKPSGIVLAKCKDYISSGRLWLGCHRTILRAEALGFEVVDLLQLVGSAGPQPPGRRQVHARRNYSTLLVLKKEPM